MFGGFGIGYHFGMLTGTVPGLPGLCNVTFKVMNKSTPVEGATVSVELESPNPTIDAQLMDSIASTGTTNASGEVTISMIRADSFTRSDGIYRIRVRGSDGRRIHDRRVTVPNQPSCWAEDLINAPC